MPDVVFTRKIPECSKVKCYNFSQMTTLCFGGSFNPVHNAHLACSQAAARAAGFGRVLLIPSHQPVLKARAYDLAPAEHRVAMLLLAAEAWSTPDLTYEIDPLELERNGPTYTIDTVEILLKRGLPRVDWLIGADQLLNLNRWHRFPDLIRLTQFHVMQRPGYAIDWSRVHPDAQSLREHVIPVPQMDISATDIRARVREGEAIDELVPANVREYILRHRLFIP